MSKTRMIGLVCICSLLVLASVSGEAIGRQRPYEGAMTTARSQIWQAINSGKCGSATAAITVDGKVVYAEGFGMANREKSVPVTKDTLFNIGSISKVYVAAAIMLLVDDGKVALDKPVTDYLPEFRMADDRYKKITVRMLLNHVSGIPGTEMSNSFGYQYNTYLKQETIDTLSRAHLKHDPGAMAVYCNDGFTLAEMIVERVSGGKYIDFLRQRVFRPLGLKNTGLSVGELKGKPVAAYYDAKTGKMHPSEVLSVLGAGGLSATAVDVCRFTDSFASENKLLKKASLSEMKKAQPSAFQGKLRNPSFSFGLGWDLVSLPRYDAAGLQVLGKSGGTGNYSSMVYTVPKQRISVAFIATGPESGAMDIALKILDAVLIETKLVSKDQPPVRIRPEAQRLPQEDAAFGGYYATANKVSQIVFDTDKKSATIYSFKEREKTPVVSLVYYGGYYHDAAGNRYYFVNEGEAAFFVFQSKALRIDTILMQKVKPMGKPKSLRIAMDGKTWVRRNISPFESTISMESHLVKSCLHKDLPGYVDFIGLKRIESPDYAGMPFEAVRDQTELQLSDRDGSTWVRVSDMLYSPAENAAVLKAGENAVKIGREGYTEWLVAGEDVILSLSKPQRGRIIVLSADGAPTHDSMFDKDDAYVARGSYVEISGLAGDLFKFKTRPAASR